MTDLLAPGNGVRRPSYNWRKAPSRLPRQHVDRQVLITNLAFALLGGRDPALTFLNTYHAALGARPLDLAGDSAAGYSSVYEEMLRLATVTVGERS